MTVVGIAALVVLVVVANSLWVLSIRYASDIQQAESPDGRSYDVLIHRDGVMLYSRSAAYFNVYSIWPTLVAFLRHQVARKAVALGDHCQAVTVQGLPRPHPRGIRGPS